MKLFAYALILAILAPTNVLAGGLRALVLSEDSISSEEDIIHCKAADGTICDTTKNAECVCDDEDDEASSPDEGASGESSSASSEESDEEEEDPVS